MVERSLEPVKILVLRLAPLNLAERRHSRKKHVLKLLIGRDILSPQVCLYTENMVLRLSRDISIWFALVNLLDRKISTDCKRLKRSRI